MPLSEEWRKKGAVAPKPNLGGPATEEKARDHDSDCGRRRRTATMRPVTETPVDKRGTNGSLDSLRRRRRGSLSFSRVDALEDEDLPLRPPSPEIVVPAGGDSGGGKGEGGGVLTAEYVARLRREVRERRESLTNKLVQSTGSPSSESSSKTKNAEEEAQQKYKGKYEYLMAQLGETNHRLCERQNEINRRMSSGSNNQHRSMIMAPMALNSSGGPSEQRRASTGSLHKCIRRASIGQAFGSAASQVMKNVSWSPAAPHISIIPPPQHQQEQSSADEDPQKRAEVEALRWELMEVRAANVCLDDRIRSLVAARDGLVGDLSSVRREQCALAMAQLRLEEESVEKRRAKDEANDECSRLRREVESGHGELENMRTKLAACQRRDQTDASVGAEEAAANCAGSVMAKWELNLCSVQVQLLVNRR